MAQVLGMAGAITGGLLAAYVDFHNDEVQATMLVVLVTAFAAGAVCPKLAWLGAVLIALCLTLTHIIAPKFGVNPLYPISTGPTTWTLMLVAIPAAVSAYLGVGLRYLLEKRIA